eukprot:gene53637-71683_t
MEADRELDTRSLNCPLPILKAKKALADMASGQVLKVVATDPGSTRDFQAFARQTGNELVEQQTVAASAYPANAGAPNDHISALKFITCGSVDDGKSTLIGRLLVDSKAVLQDHLAGVQRHGQTDLALLTDGLSAEREQGITIDV